MATTVLQFELPISGEVDKGGIKYPIELGICSIDLAPGDEFTVQVAGYGAFKLKAPAEIGRVLTVPVPDDWMTAYQQAAHRAQIRPISHELAGQASKFGWMALVGVIVFVLVQAIKTLSPETFTFTSQETIPLGGWLTVFIVLVIQGAAFMDTLKRLQPTDWIMQMVALFIDYLCVWPFFVKAITVNVLWLNDKAIAFIGFLIALLLVYLFAFLNGRDMTTAASFWATKSLVALASGTWGSVGVIIPIPISDLSVTLGLIFALGHQLWDILKPVIGAMRITTVLITGIGIGAYLLAGKLIPGPWWYSWLIAVAVTMGAAAIGSDYTSKHVEERPGALGVAVTIADRLLRENQYDAVIGVNILLVLGHITGWY